MSTQSSWKSKMPARDVTASLPRSCGVALLLLLRLPPTPSTLSRIPRRSLSHCPHISPTNSRECHFLDLLEPVSLFLTPTNASLFELMAISPGTPEHIFFPKRFSLVPFLTLEIILHLAVHLSFYSHLIIPMGTIPFSSNTWTDSQGIGRPSPSDSQTCPVL